MSTFRRYGGINNSLCSNFVKYNIFNSSKLSFNTSGQLNSKETFLSNIDMSGNSLIHVGGIYFQDGTLINNITTNPKLSDILSNGNKANKDIIMNNSLDNIGKIIFLDGKIQERTYTGFTPQDFETTTYEYASIKLSTNGQILEIKDNKDNLIPNLFQVLNKGNDASSNEIINIGKLTLINNLNTSYIQQNISIKQSNNLLNYFNDTYFNKEITQNENCIIKQTNSESNNLYSTTFNNKVKYLETFNFTSDNDIPDVGYVNNIVNPSLTPTASCNYATTTNINLTLSVSAIGSIDEYNVVSGNRVLVKNQTIPKENGIYQCNNISSPYVRAIDYSVLTNVSNYITFVIDGNVNKLKLFAQIATPGIVNTDNLFYVILYSLNYGIGRGLLVDGTTLSVDPLLNFITASNITYRNGSNTAFMLQNTTSALKSIFSLINCDGGGYYNSLSKQYDNLIISGSGPLVSGPLVLAAYNNSATSTGIKLDSDNLTIQQDSNTFVTMNDSTGIIISSVYKSQIKNYFQITGHYFEDTCNFKNGLNYTNKEIISYTDYTTLGARIFNSSYDDNWVSLPENTLIGNPSGELFSVQPITYSGIKYLLIFNMDIQHFSGGNGSNNEAILQLNVTIYETLSSNKSICTLTFGGFSLARGNITTISKNVILNFTYLLPSITYTCFLNAATNGNWGKKMSQYSCQLIRLS